MTAIYGLGSYGLDIYGLLGTFGEGVLYSVLVDWNRDGEYTNEFRRLVDFRIERGRRSLVAATYGISIDWEKSGSPTDETGRAYDFRVERGRKTLVNGTLGYTPVSAGYFSVTLDNYDGRYNPFNTSSPLYGYIKPNRPFRLTATYGGITYTLITGWIRKIIPQQDAGMVRLEGYDGLDWLAQVSCPLSSVDTGKSVADAINELVEASDWPFSDTGAWTLGSSELGVNTYLGSTKLEDNGDVIPYWWSDPDKSIWREICEIAECFAGDAFVNSGGVFSYNARTYPQTPNLYITQAEIKRDIELMMPWDEIRNDIRVTAYPRQATAADTEIWRLNEVPLIQAGATLTLWARFQYQGEMIPASSVTTPAKTTDYTAFQNADGTGTEYSDDISIVKTDYATLSILEITNGAAVPVYLTLMKLRGTGLYAQSGTTIKASDTASESEYGRSSLGLDSYWLQETSTAKYRAENALQILKSERKVPTLKIFERPEYQFAVDLFDVVNIDLPALGIDEESYLLTAIDHSWERGRGAETTWRLETLPTGFWILGTSELGNNTYLGW